MMIEFETVQRLLSQVWGNWEIIELIGHGVYTDVYRIRRTDTDFVSALKVIPLAEQDEILKQQQIKDTMHEIDVMRQLQTASNIVGIEDFCILEEAGAAFIRMELLTPLEHIQMSEQDVIRLGVDICNALIVCESCHILHCDIKPGNILSDGHGGFKLADFGCSRDTDVPASEDGFGTKNYFPPERESSAAYTNRSDLYALGLVMYRLMNNNRLPFMPQDKQILSQSDYAAAYTDRLAGKPLPTPCNASRPLAAVILRACSFQSKNRYRNAAEMKNALTACQTEKRQSRRVPSPLLCSLVGLSAGVLFFCFGYLSAKQYFSRTAPDDFTSDREIGAVGDITGTETQAAAETDPPNPPIVFSSDCDLAVFTCGKHCFYAVDGSILYISGSGKVEKTVLNVLSKDIRKLVEKVVVTEGVSSLPAHCFSGLTALAELSLPDSLEEMGDYCFENCGLKKIVLPKNLKNLYNPFAFSGITEIDCGNSSYYLMEDGILYSSDRKTALYCLDHISRTEISFPDTVEVIVNDFLIGNSAMKELVLPKSLKVIGINAFTDCKMLNSLVIPAGVTDICGDRMVNNLYFEGDAPRFHDPISSDCTFYYRTEKDGWDISNGTSLGKRVRFAVWDEAAEQLRTGGTKE